VAERRKSASGSKRRPARKGAKKDASPRRARRGRPSGLTREIADALVEEVRKVGHLEPAADVVGVPAPTAREWFRRGNGELPGRAAIEPFASFAARIKKARAEALRERLERIADAGKGGAVVERIVRPRKDGSEEVVERYAPPQWTADAWTAERLDPERFGRKSQHTVDGTITVKHATAIAEVVLVILRRYVPVEQLEVVADEVGQLIDGALGAPRIALPVPGKAA